MASGYPPPSSTPTIMPSESASTPPTSPLLSSPPLHSQKLESPKRTPSPPPKPSFSRILFTRNATNAAIVRANTELSSNRVSAALSLYTDILLDRSPGHACVFLNRALCYLQLGYPTLAAADARRAIMAAHYARTGREGNVYARQLSTCWDAISDAHYSREPWATAPRWFVAGGGVRWLDVPLACICVSPSVRGKKHRCLDYQLSLEATLKGYYILAVALWKCGSGVLKSAMDVLIEVQGLDFCREEDTWQFEALENAILNDIVDVMAKEDYIKQDYMAQASKNLDAERITAAFEEEGIRNLLRMRYMTVPRELYPWDTHSIPAKDVRQRDALNAIVARVLPDCRYEVLERFKKPPKLILVADRDLPNGATLTSDSNAMYISSNPLRGNLMFCHSCAALMSIPPDTLEYVIQGVLNGSTPSDSPSSKVRTPTSSGRLEDLNVDEYIKNPSQRPDSIPQEHQGEAAHPMRTDSPIPLRQAPAPPPAPRLAPYPPSHRPSAPKTSADKDSPGPEFQLCSECFRVAFCGLQCHEYAVSYHTASCRMGLEEYLDASVLPHTLPGMPDPQHQLIIGLAMLRVLASARSEGHHPLATDWMKLLNGGRAAGESPPRRDPGNGGPAKKDDSLSAGRVPWNYEANITRPLHCLFCMGGPALALDITRFDGWVLNTIMSKLYAGLWRVEKMPVMRKIYDLDGQLVGSGRLRDAEWEKLRKEDHRAAVDAGIECIDSDIWVGIIDPVLDLITQAGAGQDANVEIRDDRCKRSCVVSVGSKKQDGEKSDAANSGVCIKAGTQLLRNRESAPQAEWTKRGAEERETDYMADPDGLMVSRLLKKAGWAVGDTMLDACETEYDTGSGDVEMEDV